MNTAGLSNLEEIERRAYETIWQDGLVDLFVGATLVLIGYFWVAQDAVYGTFVAPVLVPVWVGARKKISEPRMGVVNFAAERVANERKKLLGLFLLGVMTLAIGVAWFFFGMNNDSVVMPQNTNLIAGLPAGLLAIPAIIVAFAHGLRRFFAYAALLLVAGVQVAMSDLHPGWAFIPAGIVCIGVGSVLLWRFVRKYPLDRQSQ